MRLPSNFLQRLRSHGCGQPGCPHVRQPWWVLRWAQHQVRLHSQIYCSSQCLERALRQRYEELCAPYVISANSQRRLPLGLLMLSRGQISSEQLNIALNSQSHGSRRLGERLELLGFATSAQVLSALSQQWACPIYAGPVREHAAAVRVLPHALLDRYRIYPIQFVEATRSLYLGFSEGIEYTVLYAIEQMLNCRTEAFLIPSYRMHEFVCSVRSEISSEDLVLEGSHSPRYMASVTVGYAMKSNSYRIRVVHCGKDIWARLDSNKGSINLLFGLRQQSTLQSARLDPDLVTSIAS